MKKIMLLALAAIVSVSVFSGCSNDGVSLAKYIYNKKEYTVKIGDIKSEIVPYISYNPNITNDAKWHNDYVFDKVSYDLIYQEQLANGLTNKPEFKASFDEQNRKNYLLAVYQKAQALFTKNANNYKYPIVKASHILLMLSKQTNINGKMVALSPDAYEKLVAEKEKIALNIIDTLKASKNIESEFSNSATRISEDEGSRVKGGNVGYFTKGMMVKEFEEAALSAKTKGLIDKPVRTDYGIHIIYVIEPVQKKSLNEVKNLIGKEQFSYLQRFFQTSYLESIKSDNMKDFYSVNLSNSTIKIDNKDITVNQLQDDMKLFEVFGKPYTWKESKDVINSFVPSFSSNLNITNFQEQLNNLKNFVPYVEYGRKEGVEKNADFQKDMIKYKDQLMKKIAFQIFWDSLKAGTKDKITPENIRGYFDSMKSIDAYNTFMSTKLGIAVPAEFLTNYYDSVKAGLTKNEKGKQIPLGFKEAESRIKDEIERGLMQQSFEAWRQMARAAYKITILDSGLKALKNFEIQTINDNEAKKKKNMRAQNQNNNNPRPQNNNNK